MKGSLRYIYSYQVARVSIHLPQSSLSIKFIVYMMKTNLTYACPMTTQGAGMLDIISSKQDASRGGLYR